MTTLSDLARVKAIFQQRAICAALGIMGAASNEGAEVESSADAALQPAPATFMGEASQEGGITHERGVTLQPSPANKTEKE